MASESDSTGCRLVSRFKTFPAVRASLDGERSQEFGDLQRQLAGWSQLGSCRTFPAGLGWLEGLSPFRPL